MRTEASHSVKKPAPRVGPQPCVLDRVDGALDDPVRRRGPGGDPDAVVPVERHAPYLFGRLYVGTVGVPMDSEIWARLWVFGAVGPPDDEDGVHVAGEFLDLGLAFLVESQIVSKRPPSRERGPGFLDDGRLRVGALRGTGRRHADLLHRRQSTCTSSLLTTLPRPAA